MDTYGGYARHGGGAFSGKDATKVDRSGAYMAAISPRILWRQDWPKKCEVQLSYSIGLAEPVSVRIDTFGTGRTTKSALYEAIIRSTDLRPAAIIHKFGLTRPIYSGVSCYGHFGGNARTMPWEQTDLAEKLKKMLD